MGNYEQLKNAVKAVIKQNGNEEITGTILQNTLLSMISNIGANATFVGIATPSTNPGVPDGKVFYLAGKGVYPNFDGTAVEAGMLAIFYNNDNGWKVSTIDLGGAGGSGIILEWVTSFSSTVLQVKKKYRVPGLIVTYKDTEGKWVVLQYTEDVYMDGTYTQIKYWQNLLTTDDYNTLLSIIKTPKRVLNDSMALETIDTIRPQSNRYPYPFDKFEQNRAYRTYQASQVTDVKTLTSDSHNIDNATLIMRARSNKANTFDCVFQVGGTEYNSIQITSEWTTYVVNSKNTGIAKQVQITPKDDIDIMAVYLIDGIIDISEIDDENIERIAIDRYNAAKNKIWDTLNLYKYNININESGKWSKANKALSSNLFKMPDILSILHKPIITGGAQKVLCFDSKKQFLSAYTIKNYAYQNVKKDELPVGTEYISIVTGYFPTIGDAENMFVYEGYFPFIETKGAYQYKESEQLIKALIPIGKNVFTDVQRNSTQPQSVSGYDYLIPISSNGKDTTALMPADGEVISISGLKGNVTAAIVYFYNSDLTKIISNTSLVASDGEYKGTVTVPSGAAMFAVCINHPNGETVDYSEFQIEYGDKVTEYESPVFGIKEICGYPIASTKNETERSSLSFDIGTVFIFGDSITATNNQTSLEGDPDSYPNNVLAISWVPDTMARLGITKWYNFALGGAVWTDVDDASSFQQMSTQVNKAVTFSQEKSVIPDLVIVAMGANNNYNGDAETDYDAVMHKEEDASYGYTGIPYEELDRTQLPQAIRWNLHTLEKNFPNAIKLLLTPPQSANRDYITDKGNNQKIKLIELFANAYCFEVIPQHKEAGIVRQFETTGKVEGHWVGNRDLADQVHPNANGRFKIVRYLANKIAARYLV